MHTGYTILGEKYKTLLAVTEINLNSFVFVFLKHVVLKCLLNHTTTWLMTLAFVLINHVRDEFDFYGALV